MDYNHRSKNMASFGGIIKQDDQTFKTMINCAIVHSNTPKMWNCSESLFKKMKLFAPNVDTIFNLVLNGWSTPQDIETKILPAMESGTLLLVCMRLNPKIFKRLKKVAAHRGIKVQVVKEENVIENKFKIVRQLVLDCKKKMS